MKDEIVPYCKAVGERIRDVSKLKGISQEELADQAQLSTAHVSEIIRGKKEMRISSLCRIAEALNTPTDYLLRPAISSSEAYYKTEFNEILDGCSHAQIELIIRMAREIKKSKF